MRGLPVRLAELTAEVGPREPSNAGEIVDPECLEVPRVSEILCSQEVAGWRNEGHERSGYPQEGPPLPSSNCSE